MKIFIGDQYLVTTDDMNTILKSKYEKLKNGEPSGEFDYKTLGYYKNLETACEALLDRELRINDAENLGELVKIIYDTKKAITAATQPPKKADAKADEEGPPPGQTSIDEFIYRAN